MAPAEADTSRSPSPTFCSRFRPAWRESWLEAELVDLRSRDNVCTLAFILCSSKRPNGYGPGFKQSLFPLNAPCYFEVRFTFLSLRPRCGRTVRVNFSGELCERTRTCCSRF